jgi:Flp pilus assembly protein TadG
VRTLQSFWADQRGNTAILFGLAVVPILALSGGALDFTYRGKIRTEIQSASDAAALAAARILQEGQTADKVRWGRLKAQARKTAADVYDASVARSGGKSTAPNIHIDDEIVRVSADVAVPTSFLTVIGMRSLPAKAVAEVEVPEPISIEIAFVLDYSGSMAENDKYARMTVAATDFIQKVADTRAERTKIAVVPFSEFVYATVPAGHVRGTAGKDARTARTTCLKNRGYPYSATNDEPRSGVVESRWPEADPVGPECAPYAANSLKTVDLSDDFAALTTALAGMRPTHLTNIALGAEIGWHVLSPGEPFDSARAYSDPLARKILILLTDGVQTVNAQGPSGSVSTEAADQTTAELCDSMSKVGIRVFTVAYDITEERVRDLLSGCASEPGNYHEAQGANDVSRVFESIYGQIMESVWLRK